MSIWKLLVAASIVVLLSIIGFDYLSSSNVDKSSLIAEVYEFPSINKSRGAVVNIVDDYIEEITTGQYKDVLASLPDESISEKDKFYKASMHFALKDYDKAKDILDNASWSDDFHKEESFWLRFLIAYQEDDTSLDEYKNQLNADYRVKAEQLLAKSK